MSLSVMLCTLFVYVYIQEISVSHTCTFPLQFAQDCVFCVNISQVLVLSKNILVFFDKMSESESDQDLNVSQYDVEDDLNAYGSPTYRAQEAAVGESSSIQAEQGRMQVSINTLSFLLV